MGRENLSFPCRHFFGAGAELVEKYTKLNGQYLSDFIETISFHFHLTFFIVGILQK